MMKLSIVELEMILSVNSYIQIYLNNYVFLGA